MTARERTAAEAGDTELAELQRHTVERLERAVAAAIARAQQYRSSADEAIQAGDNSIAKTLRLLASIADRDAALAKAELWHRAAMLVIFSKRRQLAKARKLPRPKRRPLMRDRLDEALRPHRRRGATFKELMRAWENDVLGDGLRLHDIDGGRVRIVDENGKGGEVIYTRKYVERLYSLLPDFDSSK